VTWANNRGGGGTASGTSAWTVNVAGLQIGSNVITVTARDAANLTASKTLTVTLTLTFAFSDDPLVPQTTLVRAVHFTELRAAIDAARTARGLTPFVWTDPALAPGNSQVKALHVLELRAALNQAYQAAGRTLPTYTDAILDPGIASIKALHLNEVQARVRAL
ncbi:MAG: hypothetical protein ACRELZ_10310, partial [Candidatus Rokuibacteriota bacterium]